MKFLSKLSPTLGIIIFLSLIGSLAIYYSTYWDPWAYSDSTGYIVSARNLLAGHGLGYFGPSGDFMPLSLHPPFYSLALSAIGLTGIDLIDAARWLNIVLFGAMIFTSGAFAYSLFHSSWLAISLSVTILANPSLVDVSSGAMSELLFLFTATLSICLLVAYLIQRKLYLLILSSIFVSLACLTRLNGVALAGVGIIGLLVGSHTSWKQRLRDVLIFSLISITPIGIWLFRIYSQTGTLAARTIDLSARIWPATIELRKAFIELFWSWLPYRNLLPRYSYYTYRDIFIAVITLILILISFISFRKLFSRKSAHSSTREFTYAWLWIVFVIANILVIAGSFIFTSLRPDMDPRTTLAIQLGLVFALLALLLSVINEFHLPQYVGWICTALVLIINASYAQTSLKTINLYHVHGAGYTNRAWHYSTTLQAVRNLPADIPIITNQSAALLLWLNRPAYDLCSFPCNGSGELRYGDNPLDPTQQLFREAGAALVYFHPDCNILAEQFYADTLNQLKSLTQGLNQYFSSCDGGIYFYPSTG